MKKMTTYEPGGPGSELKNPKDSILKISTSFPLVPERFHKSYNEVSTA